MPAATPIRAYPDSLHVTRAQRSSAMQQPALDQGGMTYQLGLLPYQGMHTTKGVLPVLVGHVLEDVVEESSRRAQGGGIQLCCMGGKNLSHAVILMVGAGDGDVISAARGEQAARPGWFAAVTGDLAG